MIIIPQKLPTKQDLKASANQEQDERNINHFNLLTKTSTGETSHPEERREKRKKKEKRKFRHKAKT